MKTVIDFLKYSFRNLSRKKMRNFLTILGIAIGVASVVVIADISQCGTDAVTGEMDSLGMSGLFITKSGKSCNAMLESQDLSKISKIGEVERSTPVLMLNTQIKACKADTTAILWGIDSDAADVVSISPLYGRLFNRRDIATAANVCLVDESFSQKAYSRKNIVGKKISLSCGSTTQEYKVVGIIKTGTGLLQNVIGSYIPTFVYIPYTNMQMMTHRNDFDEFLVKLKPNAKSESVSNQIVSLLNSEKGTTDAFVANDLAKQKDNLMQVLNIVTLILSAVGAVSLLVASLSIMTTMTISVTERTREIGIKKALGATHSAIMFEFLLEAALLSLSGSILGISVGSLISLLLAVGFHTSLSLRPDIMLIASAFAVASGTIFSVYPAYQASCLKPVDALRQE